MIKWLVVIGVIVAVYFFFIKKKPQVSKNDKKQASNDAQEMVECAKCGVYVEVKEAILSNGKYYCSNECLRG
jgi:uncharacterized protein